MNTKYTDKIHAITTENTVERAKQIAKIVMSTNDSLNATPIFANEVRTTLIILILSAGFSEHLYHRVMDIRWVRNVIDDFTDFEAVSAKDKEQALNYLNSAHIMVLEGMLCRVFGAEFHGETCG